MKIASIHLQDFRNHGDTSVEFGDGINAVLGNNGEGKTNLLEAVSYLSLTKSFYAAGDATVVRLGADAFAVEGTLCTDAGMPHTVRAAYVRSPAGKLFTINQVRPDTFASVIGRFPIVVLSPENSAITSGGPSERRRFLDLALSQLSPVYLEDLQEYRRILRQRNRLLLDGRLGGRLTVQALEPWTESLADHGSRIIQRRIDFVREFIGYVRSAYRTIAGDREDPGFSLSTIAAGGDTADMIRAALAQQLVLRHSEERARGTTLVGPHRDDLVLTLNGNNLQHYASQGQHKTMLVAMKVAEFFFLRERSKEVPMFLLDDLFGELDEQRSRRILDLVAGLGQTIITTTDEQHFHGSVHWNARHRKFMVEHGTCRAA